MAAASGRDPERTRRTLVAWLREELGHPDLDVVDLAVPRAGFSNETILGTATWTDGDDPRSRAFVLRIGATGHQLYLDNDVLRQADVMAALAGQVPVPGVWLRGADPEPFGAPFFLMDRVDGRTPPDLPSFHKRGWVVDLSPAERGRLYDNGLAAMASVHALAPGALAVDLGAEAGDDVTALDGYLQHVRRWHAWCKPSLLVDAATIDAALDLVLSRRPASDEACLTWGDARVGNLIFDDQLAVAAIVDWEGAALAPAALDLGWWCMFEHYLSEAQGVARLEGIPDRAATVARYEELAGRGVPHIDYYEVLAGLVFALINSRLFTLLIASGQSDQATAETVIGRVTAHLRAGMERA
jgi:aminoglycoside phosphotransferase (APT) family kinase protein